MTRVLVNGPASWNTLVELEHLPSPHPHMVFANAHRQGLGGTSAGKALGLAKLGVDVTLRTALGTDPHAALIRSALVHRRLTLLADVVDGPSEHHLNLMSADGQRLSIYLDAAPPLGAAPAAVVALLSDVSVAVLDLAEHSVELLEVAKAAGCEVWCDLHDDDGAADFQRPFAHAADVVIVSADRLDDPDAYLAQQVANGARWAVCTRGSKGAIALSADEGRFDVSAVVVEQVVDTNGAGDAFVAGLLAGYLAGAPFSDCLRQASAAGSLAVESPDLSPADLSPAAVVRRAEQVRVRATG